MELERLRAGADIAKEKVAVLVHRALLHHYIRTHFSRVAEFHRAAIVPLQTAMTDHDLLDRV
jgi:hypothetical protein